jgi:hypothetical protein
LDSEGVDYDDGVDGVEYVKQGRPCPCSGRLKNPGKAAGWFGLLGGSPENLPLLYAFK